jgi:hypothetical protein
MERLVKSEQLDQLRSVKSHHRLTVNQGDGSGHQALLL